MASDSDKYERAVRKWESLRAEQEFSLPIEKSCMAIFVTNEGYGDTPEDRDYTYSYMQVEAERYALSFRDYYKTVRLHKTITTDSLRDAVRDHTTSGIVIIGEGNLSSVYTDDENRQIWWSDISAWTNHLKQGVFFQRFCGTLPKKSVPVPFGTFAMASLSSVWAVPGKPFRPEYDAKIEAEFRPVTSEDMLSYGALAIEFSRPAPMKPRFSERALPALQMASRLITG